MQKYEVLENVQSNENSKNKYQEKWEARSSIRSRPRKYIDFTKKGYFFPEEKQPLLLNQGIINLGPGIKEMILLQSFYKYLNDIVNLEIRLINLACNKLLYEDLIVKFPDETKLNAHTVIIDEYYHVYVARDMISQLNQHYPKRETFSYPISDAYNAVSIIKCQIDKKYHAIFEILSVCIFETTLVRELVEFFNSKSVHPSIKHYVNDHMNDEARHYGFFYDLLCYIWERLPNDYRKNIGENLANFIKLYLNVNSEKAFNLDLLAKIIQDNNLSKAIIEKLYTGFDITPEIPIVKNVINVLRKSSLLDNVHVKTGFNNLGWNL